RPLPGLCLSEALLHEAGQRVRPIVAERIAIDVAAALVERDRLGLAHAGLQAHEPQALARRLLLDPREERAPEPLAARRRRDVHALHFTIALRVDAQRAAGERRAAAARDEETDLGTRQLLEGEEMVALRWIQ